MIGDSVRARSSPALGRIAVAVALALVIALVLGFLLVPIVALVTYQPLGGLIDELGKPVTTDAIVVSLKTNSAAILLTLGLGTPLAYLIGRRRFRGRRFVITLIELPLVMPPAVAGIGLLVVFRAIPAGIVKYIAQAARDGEVYTGLAALGGKRDLANGLAGLESGVAQTQWLEQVLAGVGVERLARRLFDQMAQDDVVDVGVGEAPAGLGEEAEVVYPLEGLFLAIGVVAEWVVGNQAAGMQQQLLDGDLVLTLGRKSR